MILNYSDKREKRKLIYFSERKNNQGSKAVHPLQGGSNATEEYGTRIQDIKSHLCKFERKKNAESCLVRIIIDIRMTNGMRIQQRNLTHQNLKNLSNFYDMRCKYERVLFIIHQQLNREPQKDEVFIVMSNK